MWLDFVLGRLFISRNCFVQVVYDLYIIVVVHWLCMCTSCLWLLLLTGWFLLVVAYVYWIFFCCLWLVVIILFWLFKTIGCFLGIYLFSQYIPGKYCYPQRLDDHPSTGSFHWVVVAYSVNTWCAEVVNMIFALRVLSKTLSFVGFQYFLQSAKWLACLYSYNL